MGYSVLFFGVFSACISLVRIPGNLLASQHLIYFKAETIILLILGLTPICFFVSAMVPGSMGLVTIVIIFIGSGVIDPVVTGYLYHQGSSDIRATIESFQSLIESVITFSKV